MKRLFITLAIIFVSIAPAAALRPVSAVDVLPDCKPANICQDNGSSKAAENPIFGPGGIMTKATRIVSIFVGVAAVIVIVISGFMMINAGGDATKVANARRTLSYALAGVAIAVLAQLIVSFVLDRL